MDLQNKLGLSKVAFATIELVLGILLICMPNTTLITIAYIIGAVIIVSGIITIVNNIKDLKSVGFIKGVIQSILGITFIILSKFIISANVFAIITAVILILVGVLKIITAFDARTLMVKKWWIYLGYGVLLIVLSIILLCNPFGAQKLMIMFLGIIVLIDAICRLVAQISVNDAYKEYKVKDKSNFNKDAEIIEVKEEDIVEIKRENENVNQKENQE